MLLETADASEIQDTFRRVFAAVRMPYLAVDVDKVAEALRQGGPQIDTHVSIPLIGVEKRREGLVGAWRGLIREMDPPDWVVAAILGTPALRDAGDELRRSARAPDNEVPHFLLGQTPVSFECAEETMWPAAYSTLLLQLSAIIATQAARMRAIIGKRSEGMEEAGYAAENMSMVDQTTRNQPTDLHFAFASLGAWMGGAANVQYFAAYSIAPQLRSKDYALQCARKVGYSASEARDLKDGGIVAVPVEVAYPLVQAQGDSLVFGSIPVNEISLANPPIPVDAGHSGREGYDGFLIDKHYRGVFLARSLGSVGLYGGKNVQRDHFGDFYSNRKADDLLRCRQFSVPVYEIGSLDEARAAVAQIPIRDEANGILFRGQTSLYMLERPLKVKRVLFANSCSIEPSLPTSASRHGYDYDPAHFALRFFLEHYVIPDLMGSADWKDAWRAAITDPQLTIDYAMMALAQHYGLPSHGLDVTTDLDVAAWFATQRYGSSGGVASYAPLDARAWPRQRRKWPTIFVFQNVSWSLNASLQDCRELEAFGLRALRPERQRARFFLGGHSEHRNRLAETVVCAFRLKPGRYEMSCDFDHLFPTPEEDPAYAAMLRFAEHDFSGDLKPFVNRFHA